MHRQVQLAPVAGSWPPWPGFLRCPGGIPEVLRAFWLPQTLLPHHTDICATPHRYESVLGVWWPVPWLGSEQADFPLRAGPGRGLPPSGRQRGKRQIPTLPVDLHIGLSLRQGQGQCPQPAGFVLQQQGQGRALGGRKEGSARTEQGKSPARGSP